MVCGYVCTFCKHFRGSSPGGGASILLSSYCLHLFSDPFCQSVCSDRSTTLHFGETSYYTKHGSEQRAGTNEVAFWHLFVHTRSLPTLSRLPRSNQSPLLQYFAPDISLFSSLFCSPTGETSGVAHNWKHDFRFGILVCCTYCTTMLMHTDAFKAQQVGRGVSCIHMHTQTPESFVIQQQPVVIDWSICLCVAYKWATWYSALFIWNQLRQRCCVSACSMRALFLPSLAHSFSVYASEIAARRRQGGEKGAEREKPAENGPRLFNAFV